MVQVLPRLAALHQKMPDSSTVSKCQMQHTVMIGAHLTKTDSYVLVGNTDIKILVEGE
jgi:hypothetical protein